jgi:tetratricopeptide (TPR) repeat protein
MKARFVVALLAIVMLFASVLAQGESAQYWYEKGLKLDANQSYEEALQAYDMAIKLDPKNPEYWGGKANSLWLLHRNQDATDSWKKALQLYNDTLQKNPQDVEAWLGKGRAFSMLAWSDSSELREINGDASLNAYEQALQIDPQNSTLLSLKGGALFSLRRYDEAIFAYDAALEIGFDPSHQYLKDGIFHMKGLAKAALGEKNDSTQSFQEALKGFDEAIDKADTPENLSQAWMYKGFILQEQDNYNESVKALDNATKANPKNEMAWMVMGFMLGNRLGRYHEGLQALDKALEIRPTADVWEAKSRIFNELGRYQDAIEASENALALNQNLTVAWQDKGHALNGLGRYQEALDAFDKVIDAYDEQIFAERGFALAGLNRSDEAAEGFGKSLDTSEVVLEKDNKSAYEWFWRGEALRGLNRYQDALDAYDHSLEAGPDYAISSWRGKGYVLKALGSHTGSDAAFAKAKDLGYQG